MKTKKFAAACAAACLWVIAPAFADHHAMNETNDMDAGPDFRAVEIWPCSFLDGKGMDDLNKVIRKWNRFMDEQGDTTYTAWLLTPNFVNGNMFDVGWVGVWPNSEIMGQSMQRGTEPDNRAMTAEFFDVVSCAQHALFASVMMSPPAESAPETAVLRFSNCKIADGKTGSDAADAVGAWSKHLQESGSDSGIFMWWPAFGEVPDADYSFKMITANRDYTGFANDWESFLNGRGFEKYAEIVGDTMSCDIGRMYDARSVRMAQPTS